MAQNTTINLLKNCSFAIVLKDNQKTLEFTVQEAALPGMQLGEMPIGHMSQMQRRPGDNITWNPLSLQVVCDEKLKAFREAYAFIRATKDPETSYINPFTVFDAILFTTSNKNNIEHKIHFKNAWIQSIGDLQFTATSSEDEQMVFTIELIYDYYEFEINE